MSSDKPALVTFDPHGMLQVVDTGLLESVSAGFADATIRANGACGNNLSCGTDVNTACGVSTNETCFVALNSNCGVNHNCTSVDVVVTLPV